MKTRTITLDVREEVRSGQEPLPRILNAVADLKKNQQLRVITPYRPAPLFTVLDARGLSHDAHATASGDWEVVVKRGGKCAHATKESVLHPMLALHASDEKCGCGCGRRIVEVDTCGDEFQQAMEKILQALKMLTDDVELEVRTARRPLYLYAYLDENGYFGHTEQQKDGSFHTYIHHC